MGALEKNEEPYTTLKDVFSSSLEFVLAICLQNHLHPKNSQRMHAVKNGTYVEIKSVDEAHSYLASLLRRNL